MGIWRNRKSLEPTDGFSDLGVVIEVVPEGGDEVVQL